MEDIMGLPCFWEIQLIGHYVYSFEYGKRATILRGQFSAFLQPQTTSQGLDFQIHFVINFTFPKPLVFINIEL
jgi:hypothetical protein